jgi:hypothetical protein
VGRVIGFLLGDGNLDQGKLFFSASSNSVLEKLIIDLEKITQERLNLPIKQNGTSLSRCVYYRNLPLYLFLKWLGVPQGNKVKQNYTLSNQIKGAPFVLKGVITGLFDSDAKKINIQNKTVFIPELKVSMRRV